MGDGVVIEVVVATVVVEVEENNVVGATMMRFAAAIGVSSDLDAA